MSQNKFAALVDNLLVESDPHVREALEFVTISELEQLETKALRLESVGDAIRRVESAVSHQEERLLLTTNPADVNRSQALLSSTRETLKNFKTYECHCRASNKDGPALPMETRRAYAKSAINAMMRGIRDRE